MNKRQEMYKNIEEHGQNLNNIFNTKSDSSFMALTKKEYKHLVTTLIGGI